MFIKSASKHYTYGDSKQYQINYPLPQPTQKKKTLTHMYNKNYARVRCLWNHVAIFWCVMLVISKRISLPSFHPIIRFHTLVTMNELLIPFKSNDESAMMKCNIFERGLKAWLETKFIILINIKCTLLLFLRVFTTSFVVCLRYLLG